MNRPDNDLENLIKLIYLLCDYARLGYSITHQNSCNDCKLRDCKYRPNYGAPVRWNCPLWKGEKDATD